MEEFIQIGKLSKAHGLNGAMKLVLFDGFEEFVPEELLFVQMGGDYIPYFIESVKQASTHLLVVFEDIKDANAAGRLAGRPVFLRKEDLPPELLESTVSPLAALIGLSLEDINTGARGTIEDFDDSFPQPVLIVDFSGRRIMVPWVEALIHEQDSGSGLIRMNLPEGLPEV